MGIKVGSTHIIISVIIFRTISIILHQFTLFFITLNIIISSLILLFVFSFYRSDFPKLSTNLMFLTLCIMVITEIIYFLTTNYLSRSQVTINLIIYLIFSFLGYRNDWLKQDLLLDSPLTKLKSSNQAVVFSVVYALVIYQLLNIYLDLIAILIIYIPFYLTLGLFTGGYIQQDRSYLIRSSIGSAALSFMILGLLTIFECTTTCLIGWGTIVAGVVYSPVLAGFAYLGWRFSINMISKHTYIKPINQENPKIKSDLLFPETRL